MGLGLMRSAGWRVVYCAASTMPLLSAQQYQVKLKPQGKDATIPYLCRRAPKHADQRQRQAGSSQRSHPCIRTGRVVKNAAKLQRARGIRARADKHTNTSVSLPTVTLISPVSTNPLRVTDDLLGQGRSSEWMQWVPKNRMSE